MNDDQASNDSEIQNTNLTSNNISQHSELAKVVSESIDTHTALAQSVTKNAEAVTGQQKDISEKQLNIANNQLIINRNQLLTNILLNGILTVSTVVLAYYTFLLSRETDTLKESNASQVRAYLSIVDVSTDGKLGDKDFDPRFTVKNLGITPAYGVTAFRIAVLSPLDKGMFGTFGNYDTDCSNNFNQGPVDLGGGVTRTYGNTALLLPKDEKDESKGANVVDAFPQTAIDSFKSNKSVMVIRGLVCYRDIFKIQRYVRFCRAYAYDQLFKKDGLFDSCVLSNDSN